MKPVTRFQHLFVAATFGAASLSAASFHEAAEYLDLEGASLVGYIDFTGDGSEIADKLNVIYRDIAAANPQMLPIPVDFNILFENLGFGAIGAVGTSSKELDNGLHANRWVTMLNEAPSGLFGIYHLEGAAPTSFTAAELVPADATGAGAGPINLAALKQTYRMVARQLMGPMGEDMVQQQLSMPVPGTEVTVAMLIDALSGHWDYAFKLELPEDESEDPEIKFWLRIQGNGGILERLKPLGDTMPIVFEEAGGTLTADFAALMGDAPFGLTLKATADGDLVAYSHADWTAESEGPRLADDETYRVMRAYLPEKATWFSYSAGYDSEPMLAEFRNNPFTAPYGNAIESAFDLLAGDFYKPTIAASTYEDNVIHGTQYGSYSTKQMIALVPAAYVGVFTAMAVPAFNKVRETSQEKTVTNNLRQIAAASDQYFLENGVTEVKVSELVGPEGYIHSLEPVAGESYEDMVISTQMKEISVTLEDGRVVSIPF